MRTLAIVLMVIFHFIYDLKFFGYIEYNIPDGEGWKQFRWLIISLFFLCLGISLTFAHQTDFRFTKFMKRFSQIAGAAIVISVITYFTIPKNWIFFGVLHFLALASIIVVWFRHYPKLCLLLGSTFMLVGILQWVPSRWPFYLFFNNLPAYTNDYVAIVPWLGMVFYGVAMAHSKWLKRDPIARLMTNDAGELTRTKATKSLVWPGQHSLSIYLLHQPIMLGIFYVIS